MNNIPLTALLETAVRAATAAGQHAIAHADRRTEAQETFRHDVKLVLDSECQQIAEEVILSTYPDHAILGEEDPGEARATDGYEWIIDPIDGTMNFTHGFPYWCSAVAVTYNEEVLAGCVFAPEFNACYTAHRDGPALCNGEPLQPSDTDQLETAMLFTGINKQMESSVIPCFELFQSLTRSARKVRINGSAALDICHAAAGVCDGFIETGLYLWDYAAAGLIAQRAGARLIVYPDEHELFGAAVLCANSHLTDRLNTLYQTHIPAQNKEDMETIEKR